MKSSVIDIVIGLCFIYLLYSLLVSIIGEIIASWISLRGRVLRQGITNLLTDMKKSDQFKLGNYHFSLLEVIKGWFMMEPKDFKHSKANEFFQQPAIKYLSQGRRYGILIPDDKKPSYITKQSYSSTIINMLREKGTGIHDWAKVVNALNHNLLHLDEDTHKHMLSLLNDANDNMKVFIGNLENSFDEMMDRVTGWYKRKMQIILFSIGFVIAAVVNVDTFEIANKLSVDEQTRNKLTQMAISSVDSNSEVSRYVTRVDTTSSKQEISERYDAISGQVHELNNVVGMGWNFKEIINESAEIFIPDEMVDSLALVTLSKNINASRKRISVNNRKLQRLKRSQLFSGKVKNSKNQKLLEKLEAQIEYDKARLDECLMILNSFSSREIYSITNVLFDQRPSNSFLSKVWDTNTIDSYIVVKGKIEPTAWQKIIYVFPNVINIFGFKFWGLLFTALALSLGAPFWFDMLKKIVALRAAGVKPEEKKQTDSSTEKPEVQDSNSYGKKLHAFDAVDKLLDEKKHEWHNVPGVLGVNKIYKNINGEIRPTIELSVTDEVGSTFKNKMKVEFKDEFVEVDLDIMKAQPAAIMKPTGQVSNHDGSKVGSVAGRVLNIRTGKEAVLSCAHVFQSDYSPYVRKGSTKVYLNDNDKEAIGDVFNLIKSSYLDAAIADLNNFGISQDFKAVPRTYVPTRSDRKKLNVQVHKADGTLVSGVLSHEKYEYLFKGDFGQHRLMDLIMIQSLKDGDLTEPGDSGALVTAEISGQMRSLGIVVGGTQFLTKQKSFVIPITEILNALNVKIINT